MKKREQKASKKAPEVVETTMPLRDKLTLIGVLGGIIGIFLIVMVVGARNTRISHMERTLGNWKSEYHLSGDQFEKIHAEEYAFHETDSWLFRSEHQPEDVLKHDKALSKMMNAEDGERFMKAMVVEKQSSAKTRNGEAPK